MRSVAGVALFSVTLLAVGVLATGAVLANDGRVPDDPDLPIRAGRYDEGVLAAVGYKPLPAPSSIRAVLASGLSAAAQTEVVLALREQQPDGPAPLSSVPAARRSIDDAAGEVKEFLLRIGPQGQDRKKGRWFVFAAGSGDAFGLNLVRNGDQGLRRAGWSVEKLAEFGKAQVGIGYRRGPAQVSLAASRREIGAYGISQEDTVVGVSVSVKP